VSGTRSDDEFRVDVERRRMPMKQYNVVTASDQLERIPGLQGLLAGAGGGGNDQRGFGNSGDQILINGKRLSGKSNDIGSTLQRIQARQVVRIEVLVPQLGRVFRLRDSSHCRSAGGGRRGWNVIRDLTRERVLAYALQ
jgi:hypothetical protein